MPGNPGGIWLGDLSMPHLPDVLGLSADGSEIGRLKREVISGFQGGYTGGPYAPHNIECGGGCGGSELGRGDGIERERAGKAQRGEQTPKFPLLRR